MDYSKLTKAQMVDMLKRIEGRSNLFETFSQDAAKGQAKWKGKSEELSSFYQGQSTAFGLCSTFINQILGIPTEKAPVSACPALNECL